MHCIRRLWRGLVRLLAGSRPGPPGGPAPPGAGDRQVDDYLDLLRRHPGTRTTTARLLGGEATRDNHTFLHEHLETQDDEGNLREADLYATRTCSFGHLLDQEVRPTARCQIHGCAALMCSTQDGSGDGCTGWCALCGRACCAAHRTVQTSENQAPLIVCDDCRSRFWMRRAWRWWWGGGRP